MMNNQFVISVESGTNPVIVITGNDANANGIAANLSHDSHSKVGLFCNIFSHHFPHQFSDNTKSREGFKTNMPPCIFECKSNLKAAAMCEVDNTCLPDYFPFLLRHPLIVSRHAKFLNDSRKLNNIWN